MHPLIEANRNTLHELCRRHGVARLDVFGSVTGEDFDPIRNDIDFLVEFEPLPPGACADAFFGLREALETLLDRRVDLVSLRSARNPFFRAAIEESRVPLCSPGQHAAYNGR